MSRRHTGSRVFGNEQLDARFKVGLIGHWVAGHGSGLSLYDRSGYGNHGVFVGAPMWTLGGPRNDRSAVQFAAGTDLLDCGSAPILDDIGPISITGWVRSTNLTGEQQLVVKMASDASLGWTLALDAGTIFFYRTGAAGQLFWSNETVVVDTWTPFAFTQPAMNEQGVLYLRGVVCTLQTSDIGSGLTSDAAQPLTLGGRYFDTTGLKGILDDVRIYNRELAASEIVELASPGFYPVLPVARRTYGSAAAIDAAIWQLTALTTPVLSDLLVAVDDPAGTPATKKLALSDFLTALTLSNVVVQTLTVGSGTYTPTAGMKKVLAIAVGGGGAGAGGIATDSAGGGGGGGGTCIRLMTAAQIGASKAYVVGAAGAATTLDTAGALLNAGFGGAGTAGAQAAALGATAVGGTGGTAANGDLNIPGSAGHAGRTYSGTDGMGGPGGSSVFGFGAGAGGTNVAGAAATAYGGGGSGGHAGGTADRDGGSGASGVLFMIEFVG